ncbi:MAG: hypothetical protein ABIK96_15135 [bacterium]
MKTRGTLLFALGLFLSGALPAAASHWCGENGLVRFSFVEGDSLVSVLDSGEPQGGVTRVDLYAWLTDVDAVANDGEALLAIGGYELTLDIQGAEAFILEQTFPEEGLNVGVGSGVVAYGITRGQRLEQPGTLLVHWKLMFQGRPENVRIGLDGSELLSCQRTEGCQGTGTQALYIGSASSNQLNYLFGAGYVPAWLNPVGELDTTAVRGTSTWQDVGIFQAR